MHNQISENVLKGLKFVDQCIFVIDKNKKVLWANNFTEKIFGKEFLGKACYKFLHCCTSDCKACFMKKNSSLKTTCHREIRIQSKKAGLKTFLCSSKFFDFNEHQNPKYKIVFFTDITEQKRVENALREDEEKFKLLSEQSLVGIFILQRGVFAYINKAAADMSGYSIQEIKNWKPEEFAKVVYKKDLPFLMKQYLKKIKGDKDVVPSYQWRGITKAGKIRWLEMYSKPIHYSNDRAIFVMILDITEKKRIEKVLQERGDRIQKEQETIVKLSTGLADFSGTFDAYMKNVAELASKAIDVARVSIWLLSEDKRKLECCNLFEKGKKKHSQGQVLMVKDYPVYFKAIQKSRAVDAHDALTDPRTKNFRKVYLEPLGISSMLDAGIRRSGKIIGIVCFEHIGEKRTWNDDEIAFAAEVADHCTQFIISRERIEAEASLRVSEKKYRDLYEKSLDGIFSCNLKGEFLDCNNYFERMLGYSVDELKMSGSHHITPQKWYEFETKKIRAKIISDGYSGLYEKEYKRKDGSVFPAEVNCFLMVNEKQEPVGVWGIARDISERKAYEESIKSSEEKYRMLIENLPQRIYYKNTEAVYISCNENYAKDLNIKPDEIVGKSDYDFYAKELADRYIEQDKNVMSLGKVESMEEEYTEKNRKIIIHKIKTPVKNSKGEVIGILGVFWDITEHRKTQEIIMQTEKMMSIGGLAAGMAHEINNPLAGISQNVQVLRNRMTGDLEKNEKVAKECGISIEQVNQYMEKRGFFDIIERILDSGHRAAKIVENMLTFSRKSEKNFELQNITELMDQTVDLACNDYDLKKKYDFRQIKIIKEYASHLPRISCEGSQIQQVIFNLLKNGAEAMVEKMTDLSYSPMFILRVKSSKTMIKLEIEDNGPGMDEEIRRRIFEPFYTTKEVGVGTGLGLSVSYFIITENHHGTINVESHKGKGSKFIISLPLKREG